LKLEKECIFDQIKITMNIPEKLRYTNDHEWISIDGDIVIVGITDFAQGELGDIVYVEIETKGDNIIKGDVFGTVEAVKTVSDLLMPLSGTIEEVNSALEDNPEVVNEDCYGKGWMIKIKLTGNPNELDELLTAEKYKTVIGD